MAKAKRETRYYIIWKEESAQYVQDSKVFLILRG